MLSTGLATGLNKVWVETAKEHSVDTKIFRFDGYKKTRVNGSDGSMQEVENPDSEEFNKAVVEAEKAHNYGITIGEGHLKNLLRAYYNIIKDADSLYIIGNLCRSDNINSKSRLMIKGKVSWCAEMFVNKYLETHQEGSFDVPVYLYSLEHNRWYNLHRFHTGKFSFLINGFIPSPSGNFSAICSEVSEKDIEKGTNVIKGIFTSSVSAVPVSSLFS